MIKKLFKKLSLREQEIQLNTETEPEREGWLMSKQADELLSEVSRHQLIKQVWDLTSLTHESFELHVMDPIKRFAELVQLLPASENHHHAYHGGLLDHVLEACVYALKIRRNKLLPPGAKPEEQSQVADIWTAAVIYGALFHDIGKIVFDMGIVRSDGKHESPVFLVNENIPIGDQYAIHYLKGRSYQVHGVSGLLFFTRILSRANIEWVSSEAEVFNLLVMELSGHHDKSGVIGEIVKKADQASVSKYMGGNPMLATAKVNTASLQSKLIAGLRYLIENRLKVNEKGASCFITDDGIWLVSKIIANELRSYLLELGINSVPTSNPILFDEMQSYGIAMPNAQGKAVWTCKLSIDDWSADLTFIKVHPSKLWIDTQSIPAPFLGVVEPVEASSDIDPSQDSASIVDLSDLLPKSNVDVNDFLNSVNDAINKVDLGKSAAKETSTSSYLDIFDGLGVLDSNQDAVTDSLNAERSLTSDSEAKDANANQALSESLGSEFLDWLFDRINSKKLIINDAKAIAHSLEDSLFIVSPKSFQRFSLEKFGDDVRWKDVQKSFQKCKVHQKSLNSLNIIKVKVQGAKRTTVIQGYLLKKEFNRSRILYNNPFLSMFKEDDLNEK